LEASVTNAGNKQSSTSAEEASARTVYDDIVWRIKQFQSNLEADEKMVVSIGGVASETMGLRGATIWFQGRNNQGCAVVIYSQVTVVMTAERLYRGEAPTQISFLTE
jgi:hypothetical protein